MRRAGAIACGALVLAGVVAIGMPASRGQSTVPAAITPAFSPSLAPHGRGELLLPVPNPGPDAGPALPEPTILGEVRDALATSYYRFVARDVLDQPTVELMIDALDDPYTEYLEPEAYERFRKDLVRTYFGVGLSVGPGGQGLIVTSSLDGPAREAGIRPGDVIVWIDGQDATKLPFERSTALLRGEEGTVVHLTVRRDGEREPINFAVVRTQIDFPAVRSRMVKNGDKRFGYIRVLSFREDVGPRVGAAARELAARGADAFVLDLRGDPGGLLSQAVQLTSVFLERGTVCSTWSLHKTRSYVVSGVTIEPERPLAILVDGQTASSAEIVAAALADNERAVLVGRRTYGKASVQTLFDLSNGGALKLTTARYLTPSGTNISETGIRPDVKASDDPFTRRDEALRVAEQVLLEQL